MKRTEFKRKPGAVQLARGGPLPRTPWVVTPREPRLKPIAASRVVRLTGASALQRRTPLRQVSRKRAAQVRERRAMLQAKYPGITLCEVPFCNQVADDAHEPLTRARGGSITDPGNVKAVCRPHHDEITFEEPEWAYLAGFLVHSWSGTPAAGGAS